jgi:hypothetical protein
LDVVSRLDKARRKWSGLPNGYFGLSVVGGLIAVALMFQLFFRYQYLENNGVLWRVDRLTQKMCQVNIGEARCKIPPSTSVSTSTTLSTSTSVSTAVTLKKKPKPH